MNLPPLTSLPIYRPTKAMRFGQGDTSSSETPICRPLSLGLTVLQDTPEPDHQHQPDDSGVKPCCRGKQKTAGSGLSLTVLTDAPQPQRPATTLPVIQPRPHKPGGSCCGGHKAETPMVPVKTTGGSCCGTKPGDPHPHAQPEIPAPTTLAGKIVHAFKSVVIWFGHFFGSFLADMKLLVTGKAQ